MKVAVEEWKAMWRSQNIRKRKEECWKDILDAKQRIKLMKDSGHNSTDNDCHEG